ncbi:LytTR family transcriptional regulator DNA-binding domain-containing protein [Aerococcus sp. UMB7834]|uniref:LytR/AlgR family response regulator transcription factor n=1 Tax=Aerococcus sp. UMB7834 TaxID=3046342 RepID=UPI002550461A|nr:LytTR family transcriptional regulator DNA-binding domain-containing protein [Aerococcus sp. UMB7834]MDK6805352.1 LytTR family transcriptional regulator DNA-binding domain-containing protein [Aerococcus sp. UMB7834]
MHLLLVDDEPLARDELQYLIHNQRKDWQIEEAASVEEALTVLLSQKIDLVFLDVQLVGETGLKIADVIRQMPKPPLVVFATAYQEYALDAFNLNAVDYIMKPFEEDRVEQCIQKIEHLVKQPQAGSEASPKRFPVQEGEAIVLLDQADIQAIVAEAGNTLLYTSAQAYNSSETLKSFAEKLADQDFLQVHRSYIVRLSAIKRIEPYFNQTYMLSLDQLKVPVSRSYTKIFRDKLGF